MKSIQILAVLVFICSTGKSQTQLWLEDFNLIGEGDMCGTGIVYAPDSNFTIQCGAGSDFIGAFIVADSIPFIFDDSEGVELETPIISISNSVASISLEISGTSSLDPTDSFSLYTNIDGTGYNLKAVRSDESDLNDIYINGLTGSTLQVKVVVFNDHSEQYYIDNFSIEGCDDIDSDGICDLSDDCIDFPVGNCGCINSSACNYNPIALFDDGTCTLPYTICAPPTEDSAYVYLPNPATAGCDCMTVPLEQLYLEHFDDEININNESQYLSICSNVPDPYVPIDNNWTMNCGSGSGVFAFPSSQSGTDLSLNVYQASDAMLTTASVNVSNYAFAYVSATVEPNFGGPNLEPSDGWDISIIKDGIHSGSIASLFDDVITETEILGFVELKTTNALQVLVEGDAPDAGEDLYLDDIQVLAFGRLGCTDNFAINYDSVAVMDDSSCVYCSYPMDQLNLPVTEDFSNNIDDIGFSCAEWTVNQEEIRSGHTGMVDAYWMTNLIIVPDTGTVSFHATFDLEITVTQGNPRAEISLQKSENGGPWSTVYYSESTDGADLFPGYSSFTFPGTVQFRWSAATRKRSANLDNISITFEPYSEMAGCTDFSACNYSVLATEDDGSCYFQNECGECNGPGAIYECGCTQIPDGDCDCAGNSLDALGVCGGSCNYDFDADGVCDDLEILGCTYILACNFLPSATNDDGSCIYPNVGFNCIGECIVDTDGDGTCDAFEVLGCTSLDAINFHPASTEDDGTCVFGFVMTCFGDIDGDDAVGVGDILEILANFGTICN